MIPPPEVIVDRSVCGSESLDETMYLWHRLGSFPQFQLAIGQFELVLRVDDEEHRTVGVGLNILVHSTTMDVRLYKSEMSDSRWERQKKG